MKPSKTITVTGGITATGYSYKKACTPHTYRVAVVLAANRAQTNEWASAQVEGGCARQTVQLSFHSSRSPTGPVRVEDAGLSETGSLSSWVPNNEGPRASGAPKGGYRGGDRLRVWDPGGGVLAARHSIVNCEACSQQ